MFNIKEVWRIIQHKSCLELNEYFAKLTKADCHNLVDSVHKRSGDSPMHIMARHGKLSMLEFVHEKYCAHLEKTNLDGKTLLHEAASMGHAAVVEYLITCGVKCDPLKRAGWTPLLMACTRQLNVKVLSVLINAGANPDLKNKDGWNCFHVCSRDGDIEMLDYLITNAPKSYQTVSNNGRTPLHTAALHGRYKIVDFLLNKCSDFCKTDVKDACGSIAFMDAVRSGNIDTITLLYRADSNSLKTIDEVGRNCLHVASEAGKSDSIFYLIKTLGFDPNTQILSEHGSDGQTALHLAYKEGNHDAVSMLIELGANENIKDRKGRIPSMMTLKRTWTNS